MSKVIVILGDQLTLEISSLQEVNKATDTIFMAEIMEEATYTAHHQQKLVLVFSAMRHFAGALQAEGYQVIYRTLTDPENKGSLLAEMEALGADEIIVTEPAEYRLKQAFESSALPITLLSDDRFFCDHATFQQWAAGRKQLVMEYFYREMRKSTGLLMDADNKPEGGNWNYDKQNRKPLKDAQHLPPPFSVSPDTITQEVIKMVEAQFPYNMGKAAQFHYAVTREEALAALEHFCFHALPFFGDYQDAMVSDQPYLFHSIVSPYVNVGLLSPREICERVIEEYHTGRAPINAVEGYVRQILGWREFIRGVYWLHMPGYTEKNYLEATAPLPDFYWNAHTDMHCMQQVIQMTIDTGYSHHIQRLMITGNYATLAGLNPQEVHDWYLAVYVDAHEWVEAPNTIGMALHADGGIVGTKPYIASGAYINRMSNFCKECRYDVKQKEGENACPFNVKYWDFLRKHRPRFEDNPRMKLMYRNL